MSKKRTNTRRGRLGRRGGGGDKRRTTVRAVYRALSKYPRGIGASVRTLHRAITRNEKGRKKRSLSSVKLAVSRAVRLGNIRAPKGWGGFRGCQAKHAGRKSRTITRRSRLSRRRSSVRSAGGRRNSTRRKSQTRKRSTAQRRPSTAPRRRSRSTKRRPSGGKIRAHISRSPLRSGGGFSVLRGRRRSLSHWRGRRKPPLRNNSSNNNHADANLSANSSSSEIDENKTITLWQAYACVIS